MTVRESDHRILPQLELFDASDTNNEKPSNAGAGKAVTPTRDSDHPPSIRSDGPTVTERLSYIHDRAQKQLTADFDNVFHLLKYELLWHAFRRLKRNKAPGIDGQSVDDYEANCGTICETWHRGYSGAPIDLSPVCGKTSRKGMERRGRWASPASRIRSYSVLL